MADLELARRPSGKYDFVLESGDLRKTDSVSPSVIRLLLQGAWIGDNGERNGQSLNDVRLIDSKTASIVTGIVDNRMNVLVQRGDLASSEVLGVEAKGDRIDVGVKLTEPGRAPEVLYVPLTR